MKKLFLNVKLLLLCTLLWNCQSETRPIPADCDGQLRLELQDKSDVNCGANNGRISVVVDGLGGSMAYSINNGPLQISPTFNNLTAGSYTIKAVQGECSKQISVTLENINGVNANLQTTGSNCETSTGTIAVLARGGSGPFQYKLDNNEFQTSASFNTLSPGRYQVTVKDATGCEVLLQAHVKSDIGFGTIRLIIQANCAISGCHNGSRDPNLSINNNIFSNADRILLRTNARTMPPSSSGITLTDQEINQIACWVGDGASLN